MENEKIERPGDVNIDELSIQNDFGERLDLTLAQITEINFDANDMESLCNALNNTEGE